MSALHALIIDDNTRNLSVMSEMLSEEGITSTLLENPTRLFDVIGQLDRIDLIFLDLEMPQQSGYEVLEAIKAYLGEDFPVVACTVHVNEINTARRLGFHSFLPKPLDVDRFPDQLQRILSNQPVWETF